MPARLPSSIIGTQQFIQTITVGNNPQAIAIDPTSDVAVVVNENDNDVSLINLGALRPLQITETSATSTLSSSTPISLNVIGDGFLPGAVVRFDGTPLTTSTVPTACPAAPVCRELVATIPATMLDVRAALRRRRPKSGLDDLEHLLVLGNSAGRPSAQFAGRRGHRH